MTSPDVAKVSILPVVPRCYPGNGEDAIGGEVEVLAIDEDVVQFRLRLENLLSGTSDVGVQFPEAVDIRHVDIELGGAVSVQVWSQDLVSEEAG